MITGLVASFSNNVQADPGISAAVQEQVGVRLEGEVSFVTTDQVRASAERAGIDPATTDQLVDDYAEAQLRALKTGLLAAALLSCAAFLATRRLPRRGGPADVPAPSGDEALAPEPAR